MEKYGLFIDGSWVESDSHETFEAFSPSSRATIGHVAAGSRADVDRAVAAARRAVPTLSEATVAERASWCERVAAVLADGADELAEAVSLDQGKPLHTEARAEVATAVEGFREAAGHARHLYGRTVPVADPGKRVWTRRVPRGAYAVITPWNFPVNIPTEYLAPALATGNAVVWVPAPTTSLAAIKFMQAIETANLPPGAINMVTGRGDVVGDAAVSHPGIHGIGFTGSTATGHRIAARGAGKPLLLELGGNGPTVVYEDADLRTAAQQIAASCFMNAGQTCAATEVIFAQATIADELAELLAIEAKKARLGDPGDPETTMGPLNNDAVAEKMDRHVSDAASRGAAIVTGGRRAPQYGSDLYYEPTVLKAVSMEAQLVSEETFGPIAPVVAFDDPATLLDDATSPQFGLVSSIWSGDLSRAIKVAESLRTGIVNINDGSAYWEIHVPFGGGPGTLSGLGRLGGMHTLEAMTEIQTITMSLDVAVRGKEGREQWLTD